MKKSLPLFVAAIVFIAIATIHVLRVYHNIPVMVDGQEVPHWMSLLVATAAGVLGLWMIKAMCCKKCSN